MANLEDLFKYKSVVEIKHPKTGKILWKGWIRILGDADNEEAARKARLASALSRKALRDKNSAEYVETQEQVEATDRQSLVDLVLTAENNKFLGEAFANVDREDVTKMEEVAILPDAPTLEEQEKYDELEAEKSKKYSDALEAYVAERRDLLQKELEALDDKKLQDRAKEAMNIIIPTSIYLTELLDQKVYLGTFKDEACTKREFTSLEGYKNAHETIRSFLRTEYQKLELSPDEIKN